MISISFMLSLPYHDSIDRQSAVDSCFGIMDRLAALSAVGGSLHLPYPGEQSNGGNSPHKYRLPLRFRTGPMCGSKNGTAPRTFSITHHRGFTSSITLFAASIREMSGSFFPPWLQTQLSGIEYLEN